MHSRIVFATAGRVLRQLSHDHRTVALLFVVPALLLALIAWIYSNQPLVFDRYGAPVLGIFPFIVMFLVTSIATLRERSSGTLERLMASPMSKFDFLIGYALAFGLIAAVQALCTSAVAVGLLGLDIAGPYWYLVVAAILSALLGSALGLCMSAFARTEFQAVQFMPALIFPQLLLGGLLLPIDKLPVVLEAAANILPLTYVIDAMQRVTVEVTPSYWAYVDIVFIVVPIFAAIALGAITLRRQVR